jgi:hypothetical protein
VKHRRIDGKDGSPFDFQRGSYFPLGQRGHSEGAGWRDGCARYDGIDGIAEADQHPGRQAELAGVRATLAERRATIDRYLRAFEDRRLPEWTCANRLAQLDREVQRLEARAATLEAECDTTPTMATGHLLAGVRGRIERAAADGAPEQLKQLLDAVVEQIQVESCACIQPYFVAPTVRTRIASRRRTTKHTNTGAPGPMLWVNARGWGHAG